VKTLPGVSITEHIERKFWALVRKGEGENACWEWTGGCWSNGYGQIRIRVNGESKRYKAHRVAYAIQHGEWAKNLTCHTCDNRKCVRGDHLFDGTCADNLNDMRAKGRAATGSKNGTNTKPESRITGECHHNAKLSDAQAAEIKRRFVRRGPYRTNAAALAREFNISASHVTQIGDGVSRRRLED
jgi:hypothetical protein